MTPEQRLMQLGLSLPNVTTPVGSYVPVVQVGSMLITSGHLPMRDGQLLFAGKVGADLTLEQGAEAAKAAALNALAQLTAFAKGLDRITRIVRVGVFVNSAGGFTQQPKVANGASDLFVALFGDAGRHARTSVGVNELPLDAAVEVEVVALMQEPGTTGASGAQFA